MAKIIRLTESNLIRLVKKVIKEESEMAVSPRIIKRELNKSYINEIERIFKRGDTPLEAWKKGYERGYRDGKNNEEYFLDNLTSNQQTEKD
jgi:hypothetical protein